MTISLDPGNRAPLYQQIFLILKSKIHDGEYKEGSYIPGERELSEMFKVSRITAVRALNELSACGLVVRERGRGTRVQFVGTGTVTRGPGPAEGHPRTTTVVPAGSVGDLFAARPLRKRARITVYGFEYLPASREIAEVLGLAEGEEVQYAVRVPHFEGHPVSYLRTFVPAVLGRGWSRKTMETTSLQWLLRNAGVEIERIEERLTATLAEVILAERLGVTVGSPLIKITRTAYSTEGMAVEHLIGLYPPDRFQYSVSVLRGKAERRGPFEEFQRTGASPK